MLFDREQGFVYNSGQELKAVMLSGSLSAEALRKRQAVGYHLIEGMPITLTIHIGKCTISLTIKRTKKGNNRHQKAEK